MFCEKCGKEIKDGDKFCPYCGAENEINKGNCRPHWPVAPGTCRVG